MTSLQLKVDLFCTREHVFDAYTDTAKQSAITGAPSVADGKVGGMFSLWSSAVTGVFVALRRPELIVQTWRTHDFENNEPDSRVEIRLQSTPQGCRFIVTQDQIPKRLHKQFVNGWTSAYFKDLAAWTAQANIH